MASAVDGGTHLNCMNMASVVGECSAAHSHTQYAVTLLF